MRKIVKIFHCVGEDDLPKMQGNETQNLDIIDENNYGDLVYENRNIAGAFGRLNGPIGGIGN
jgi:hypothetical protein